MVFPILFLLLAGIVVYLVLDLTGIVNAAGKPQTDPSVELSGGPSTPKPAPNSNATPVSLAPRPTPTPGPVGREAARLEELDLNPDGELPPTPRIDLDTPVPGIPGAQAGEDQGSPSGVLEKFLQAGSLEAREPYLSTSRLSSEELADSSLGGPLPEVVNRRSIHYMENRSERHKEHFFEVFFQMADNERPVPILVQLNDWGDGKIQVHTDAFLDLFDDNLGKFSEAPVEGLRTFHVVADAYKHCFDDIIPGWEKKSVLKLRTHPRMAPHLVAYFNRNSALADEISQPNALPWGETGICTVTVEWNTDTPERPFVELRRIDGFTWNP